MSTLAMGGLITVSKQGGGGGGLSGVMGRQVLYKIDVGREVGITL